MVYFSGLKYPLTNTEIRWCMKLTSLDLIANLLQQAVGGKIENTEGLNCNWLKKITAVEVCIISPACVMRPPVLLHLPHEQLR